MKIVHWVFTGLLSALMMMSASMYLFKTEMVSEIFTGLGFPTWLIYPMAIAKIVGVIILWAKPTRFLVEWAYAGFLINLLLAFGAHMGINDNEILPSIIGMVLLIGSYITWRKSWGIEG